MRSAVVLFAAILASVSASAQQKCSDAKLFTLAIEHAASQYALKAPVIVTQNIAPSEGVFEHYQPRIESSLVASLTSANRETAEIGFLPNTPTVPASDALELLKREGRSGFFAKYPEGLLAISLPGFAANCSSAAILYARLFPFVSEPRIELQRMDERILVIENLSGEWRVASVSMFQVD